jgi:hypothetical protein
MLCCPCLKVFDETCGYYGKQAYIVQFERDLDSRGVYDAFRNAYAAIAGKPWERGANSTLLKGPTSRMPMPRRRAAKLPKLQEY